MASIMEIMQLCRLCLVKEQVNIPIFEDQGDIRQIFLKITACLPVKVSKEDQLPKKICDGCLYKLELLYQFWNTTANAEKQLLSWIEQSNMDLNSKPSEESSINTHPQVKQEKIEPTESTNENADLSADAQNYILQQQQLAYQANFPYKESQGSNVEGDDAVEDPEEPEPKRRRRGQRRQATKPIPPESLDSSDNEAADTLMEMTVTKTEEESESDGDENVDDPESSKFVTVAEDREQPGPSGLGKGTTEAPMTKKAASLACAKCGKIYSKKKELKTHQSKCRIVVAPKSKTVCPICKKVLSKPHLLECHIKMHDKSKEEVEGYLCDICGQKFNHSWNLNLHSRIHSGEKPYKCSYCDKDFSRRSYLVMHERIHSGERPYSCPHCDKSFNQLAPLRIHIRGHTGERPYICQICDNGFISSGALKMHQNNCQPE